MKKFTPSLLPKLLVAAALSGAAASPAFAIVMCTGPLLTSAAPACSSKPVASTGPAQQFDDGAALLGQTPGFVSAAWLLRVPVDPPVPSPSGPAPTPVGRYSAMVTDPVNTPGVTYYASQGCTWSAQSSTLSTQIGWSGGTATAAYLGTAGCPGGTGPLSTGSETILGMWTDNPKFQVSGCQTGSGASTGCTGQTISNQYNVEYQTGDLSQMGIINYTYTPTPGEASGTIDYGNVVLEISNSTGVGYYLLQISGTAP